ncbi:MAG: VOC family protein [Crocinitomicaceae bacterium]|nr:VOC family protein [Crocinitomicaceae bacterium]
MNIQELTLYSNNLANQKRFYSQTLGFQIIVDTDAKLSFQIGVSVLTFEYTAKRKEQYHFAFNIPSNQEEDALLWLKDRLDVLKDGDSEIQYFDFWDANAIYFYDNDRNIVEFIARKTLKKESSTEFSSDCVFNISEIGMPTANMSDIRDKLINQLSLPQYSGDVSRFCSIGNEEGLFICLNKEIKDFWYPTNEKTYSVDFEIRFSHNGNYLKGLFENDKLNIVYQ